MRKLKKYKDPFFENALYHIYNKTNNQEKLFKNDADCSAFLSRFFNFLGPFLEVSSWNLLGNHFHFSVRIRDMETIIRNLNAKQSKALCGTEKKFLQEKVTFQNLIENTFRRFFISYSLYFNTSHNRKGNLFNRPFKHVAIDRDSHFTQTIIYIHGNAIKHNLCRKIEDHKWSSFKEMLSDKPTSLMRNEVLEWFGGRKRFIRLHKELIEYYYGTSRDIELD